MNDPLAPPVSKSERRLARWLLVGLLLFVTPIVVAGVGAASMFRLSRDAAMLRREVMAASDSDWNTKVQVSVGWCTLATARTVLRFVEHEHADDARLALSVVRRASVGVYQRVGRAGEMSRERLFAELDRRMGARGWSRMIGVLDHGETVLVYAADDIASGGRLDLCVAVVDGDDMVVVSTRVDADKLMELAERHLPEGGLREKVKDAKIRI
ncbi:MAG: hypothetical protein ACOZE5_10915 [Verrucomicrobiota bacterium]